MANVVIYGNKSMAREFYFCLKGFSDHEVAGFTVDKDYMESDRFCDLPLVPFEHVPTVFPPSTHKMLVAVGYVKNNVIRQERYSRSKEMGYELLTYVSPKAIVSPDASIGDNCFIDHFTIISPDVRIGNDVIIRSGCMIGHDVLIEDHCFFSPGVYIAGSVSIGTRTYFSIGSIVRNKVSIGKECVIGAGAVILENTRDKAVYLGEPATLLPISSSELPLA